MNIAVFGLGYVGVVSAACLARDGHEVIGVDPQAEKVRLVEDGRAPIVEPGVAELIAAARAAGHLRATTDAAEAVAASETSLVCVGTPSRRNGSLDTAAVERVSAQIGAAVARAGREHRVVMRSTVLPGTMRGLLVPALEGAAGPAAGRLRIANNPEFLRESTAVRDYDAPPKTVVGADDAETAEVVLSLYARQPGPKIATTPEIAEMVKYADNAWHAAKVVFGNEIGTVAKALGIDSHAVMDIFCRDETLNISPAYLRPGFAFGGSCLPKDLRALTYRAKTLDLELPLLESLMRSNAQHVERAVERVLATGARRVALLGLSFKAGTDDLRESPLVALVERLIGKGIDLRIYDRNVHMARLVGANRDYIVNHIPHISSLLSDDLEATAAHGELVIVGNAAPEFARLPELLAPGQRVLDLVRLDDAGAFGEGYDGVAW
jgi:GDP-mannose 6-dehydrogenase